MTSRIINKLQKETDYFTWKETVHDNPSEAGIDLFLVSNRVDLGHFQNLICTLIRRNGSHKGLKSMYIFK